MQNLSKINSASLDILVNNAAINSIGNIEESTEEDFQKTMNINVFGTFLVTKYMIPLIKKSTGGSIINIASNIGIDGYGRQDCLYCFKRCDH